jgi:trans-aconitate methyltransferase
VMVHATHTGAHQVVDLGGGTGNFTRLLAARAPSCVCHTS